METTELDVEEARQKGRELYERLPSWHRKNTALIANTLIEARRLAPHLSSFAESLLPKMPRMVRASQNLRSINIENASHLFNLEQAIPLPWISFDAKQSRNVLLFDIDHAEGPDLVADLPPSIRPTLVVDPWSGRSHGILPLTSPVLRGGKIGPEFLADLAHQLLAKYLKATPLPVGSCVKNPFGAVRSLIGALQRGTGYPSTPIVWESYQEANTGLVWHTIPGSAGVELREIVAHLADEYDEVAPKSTRRRFIHRGEPSALGRNCALFDLVRWWAYDNNETDGGQIMKKADEINATFQPPLPFPEVKATARSIGRFMASRYRPKSALEDRRGVMGLAGTGLATQQKQKLSAHRTNDIQSSNTDHKIQQALKHFPAHQKLTQAALAKASGVSLRTIKARWSTIKPTT